MEFKMSENAPAGLLLLAVIIAIIIAIMTKNVVFLIIVILFCLVGALVWKLGPGLIAGIQAAGGRKRGGTKNKK